MNEQELEKITEAVAIAIKSNVNGKIDKLSKDFEEHRREMKPILDAYVALTTGKKILIGLSSVIIAVGTVYLAIKKMI